MTNAHRAGASAAVIIAGGDDQLQNPSYVQSGAQAGVPSARISQSSGTAVLERTQREPDLTVTLAVPEGADICHAQQNACGQQAPEDSRDTKGQGMGVEIVLTPQVPPLLLLWLQCTTAVMCQCLSTGREVHANAACADKHLTCSQATFWLSQHGLSAQADLAHALRGLTESLIPQRQ